jgi:hypothetical protein
MMAKTKFNHIEFIFSKSAELIENIKKIPLLLDPSFQSPKEKLMLHGLLNLLESIVRNKTCVLKEGQLLLLSKASVVLSNFLNQPMISNLRNVTLYLQAEQRNLQNNSHELLQDRAATDNDIPLRLNCFFRNFQAVRSSFQERLALLQRKCGEFKDESNIIAWLFCNREFSRKKQKVEWLEQQCLQLDADAKAHDVLQHYLELEYDDHLRKSSYISESEIILDNKSEKNNSVNCGEPLGYDAEHELVVIELASYGLERMQLKKNIIVESALRECRKLSAADEAIDIKKNFSDSFARERRWEASSNTLNSFTQVDLGNVPLIPDCKIDRACCDSFSFITRLSC